MADETNINNVDLENIIINQNDVEVNFEYLNNTPNIDLNLNDDSEIRMDTADKQN